MTKRGERRQIGDCMLLLDRHASLTMGMSDGGRMESEKSVSGVRHEEWRNVSRESSALCVHNIRQRICERKITSRRMSVNL